LLRHGAYFVDVILDPDVMRITINLGYVAIALKNDQYESGLRRKT